MPPLARSAWRGWNIVEVVLDDGESGKSIDRAGLRHAPDLVAGGDVAALVASKLDGISRSVMDDATMPEWTDAALAFVVPLDGGAASTPGGRRVSHVLASVTDWERDTIVARTRDGLAAPRAHRLPGAARRLPTTRSSPSGSRRCESLGRRSSRSPTT